MSLTPSIQTINGRPGPVRALEFKCVANWSGTDDAILVALRGRLKLINPETAISEPLMIEALQWPDSNNPVLKRDRTVSVLFTIAAPLTPAAISFVEEQAKAGDVGLQLELWYEWQEGRRQQVGVAPVGPALWHQTSVVQIIPHSEWIKRLAEMQWAKYQLFQVASLPLNDDQNLAESLHLLRGAEKKLRDGDYPGVLAGCREAFESAAKYAAKGGELRTGFDALLTQGFPEHRDKPAALDGFIRGLSGYLHLARHGQYPAIRFTRAEAEFVFATTISFFSLLSSRLAKLETID